MFSKANFAGRLSNAIATPASLLDPIDLVVSGFCINFVLSMSVLANMNAFLCCLIIVDQLM